MFSVLHIAILWCYTEDLVKHTLSNAHAHFYHGVDWVIGKNFCAN